MLGDRLTRFGARCRAFGTFTTGAVGGIAETACQGVTTTRCVVVLVLPARRASFVAAVRALGTLRALVIAVAAGTFGAIVVAIAARLRGAVVVSSAAFTLRAFLVAKATGRRGAILIAEPTRTLGAIVIAIATRCLLYTSPSPRDQRGSRMPSSA